MKEIIKQKIEIPENVEVRLDDSTLILKGKKGEVQRNFINRIIKLSSEGKEIKIYSEKPVSKKEKAIVGTFKAHIKNMIKGVTEGHIYKLKICSGHFPMTAEIKGNELIIKNFFGENSPRKMKINPEADVKIQDKDIIVESLNKEIAGQTASSIEELTKRPGFDQRIFQDGIYIYEKDGKKIQ